MLLDTQYIDFLDKAQLLMQQLLNTTTLLLSWSGRYKNSTVITRNWLIIAKYPFLKRQLDLIRNRICVPFWSTLVLPWIFSWSMLLILFVLFVVFFVLSFFVLCRVSKIASVSGLSIRDCYFGVHPRVFTKMDLQYVFLFLLTMGWGWRRTWNHIWMSRLWLFTTFFVVRIFKMTAITGHNLI